MLRSGFEGEDDDHRKNYLYRIATNLLRDHFRRSKPVSHEVPERGDSPAHEDAVHLRSDVGGAMAELAPRDRQMLWLAYVEGASHREIAKALGLRPASIRSMLFRARHRLAEQLQARGLRPNLEDS
jgi:RNA polymerase sigma-70 factor (ECF subfamily)